MPDAPRAFKTPFVPYVPIAGILVCLYVFTSLRKLDSVNTMDGNWVAIYFAYGKKRELNNPVIFLELKDPKVIITLGVLF
jgi:APA family basic amino acid/polyamine antiporter